MEIGEDDFTNYLCFAVENAREKNAPKSIDKDFGAFFGCLICHENVSIYRKRRDERKGRSSPEAGIAGCPGEIKGLSGEGEAFPGFL